MNLITLKRLTRFTFIFIIVLGAVLSSYSQIPSQKASFRFGKIKLELALLRLKEVYGMNFSYGNNALPLHRSVELNAADKTLKEVLDEILPPLGISYKLIGNTISLRPAQFYQKIRGHVTDKTSGEALVGVSVRLLNTDSLQGGISNIDGDFVIENIKVGRYSLLASFVGYNNAIVTDVIVSTGKEPLVTISMEPSMVSLEEVIVRPGQLNGQPLNHFTTVGGRSFFAEETKRFASNFNDPARMVAAFPGITANNDFSNSMAIRGNSPNSMQWRIEGMEMPSPSHFATFGGSGGAISMLSLNMIDRSDFFSGAFPAEYGNALSGVMDIKLRKGNDEKMEGSFQAGLIGFDLAAEGPLQKKRKSSYLVNYRYSTLGVLENIGAVPNGAPQYQDLSFNLTFPQSRHTTNVWGIAGKGAIIDNDSDGDAFNTAMALTGITHQRNLNTTTSLAIHGAAAFSLDELIDKERINGQETIESGKRRNISHSFRVSSQLNKRFSKGSIFRSGIVFSYQQYQLLYSYVNFSNNLKNETPVDASAGTGYVQYYSQWRKYFFDKFILNAGVHGIYFLLNHHYSVEPRAGLRYEISPSESIGIAAGLHSRIQPLTLYYEKLQADENMPDSYPNKNLDLSKALHSGISYDRALGNDYQLRVEAYYQYLFNVPVYFQKEGPVEYTSYSTVNQVNEYLNTTLINRLPFPLVNSGTGRNYGFELTFEKSLSNGNYFLLTNSLYQSKYKGSDGIERNTLFNGGHIFTALAGKEFQTGRGRNNTIELNGRVTWSGNNRQTPIDIVNSWVANHTMYDYDQSYSTRLPDYFRMDLHFGFRKNKRRTSHTWSFDLRNVTDRKNVRSEWLDFSTAQIKYSTQLGIIPVLSYRIDF